MKPGESGYDALTVEGTPAHGPEPKAATRNACKLCSPLGASLVFKGLRGCLPFLHGSQGCATYIRRYLISHFREPVDIASSSFSEDDAIFGGADNFRHGIDNVIRQYQPEILGVATTCLSETIGENMLGMIRDYRNGSAEPEIPLLHVSTPSYAGTHHEGYVAALLATVEQFCQPASRSNATAVNVLPTIMSCADLRHLAGLCRAYGMEPTLLPDYSETLDGESWDAYERISPGGTTLEAVGKMPEAAATLEFGHTRERSATTAGSRLEEMGSRRYLCGWPVGLRLSDQLMANLSTISGQTLPPPLRAARGRLVDSYVDGHKYVSGKRAALYGDPDLVTGMAAFLSEIGIRPVLCATGSRLKGWEELLRAEIEGDSGDVQVLSGADHATLASAAREVLPDLLVGSSKGYPLARELDIPLLRIGFPLHDRFGGQRQLTVGYEGTQALFDSVVNLILESRQTQSATGYSYL